MRFKTFFIMGFSKSLAFIAIALSQQANARLIAYGLWQVLSRSIHTVADVFSGCNTVTAACYLGAHFTFGTIAAAVAPPAIVACNSAIGSCSAAAVVVAPFLCTLYYVRPFLTI
jgi:hypothetical protein